jgi:hypothetical protein
LVILKVNVLASSLSGPSRAGRPATLRGASERGLNAA